MPSGLDHPANASDERSAVFKGLIVGETGTGKTGALASLLDAGYKLRVLDFDAGLDPLIGYAKKRDNLANLNYETLRDEFKVVGSYLAVKKAPSFQRALSLLNNWGDFGAVQTWGPDTILVIDTLGAMSKAAFNMVLQANGVVSPSGNRGGPEQSHYGAAMESIERALDWLTNPDLVPCHVIVNAHWTYQDTGGFPKAYPETVGTKLSPTVGRKFNNLFSVSISAGARSIKVKKDGMVACKASKPLKNESYSVETGLAEIFLELVGKPPA